MKKIFKKFATWMCGIASDKYAHFICCFLIAFVAGAASFYFLNLTHCGISKRGAAMMGFGIACMAGVVKEKLDEKRDGKFDFNDLFADTVGGMARGLLYLL